MEKFLHRFLLGIEFIVYVTITGMCIMAIIMMIWFFIDFPTVGLWVLGVVAAITLIYLVGWVIEKS